MSAVYVLRYSLPYEGTDMVQVYSTLRGAINRLEIMDLHDSFDEDETVSIECMEIITEEESQKRLNNIIAHYKNKEHNK
jgi:hypothetical protein